MLHSTHYKKSVTQCDPQNPKALTSLTHCWSGCKLTTHHQSFERSRTGVFALLSAQPPGLEAVSRKGEPSSQQGLAIPGGWARKEDGISGRSSLLSRARRRAALRGLPGPPSQPKGRKRQGPDQAQMCLEAAPRPTQLKPELEGQKRAGRWNLNSRPLESTVGPLGGKGGWERPFHPASETPIPSSQKTNSPVEAQQLPPGST